jgi:membrane protein
MIIRLLRERLVSFTIVLGFGFLLIVSLAVNAALAAAQDLLTQWTPSLPWLWQAIHQAISLATTTLLFMMIYKVLPDVDIAWRDVAIGALVTGVLFTVGKYAIGVYLGRMSIGSMYGAAGSFVVMLVWVYYSALVSFFGAEFTKVHARREGRRLRPEEHAVRRDDGSRRPLDEPADGPASRDRSPRHVPRTDADVPPVRRG